MEVSQISIGVMMLYSAIAGFSIGVIYDLLTVFSFVFFGLEKGETSSGRYIKAISKLPAVLRGAISDREVKKLPIKIFCIIRDFFVCLASSVALCVIFYYCNHGVIRVQALIGAVIGFYLYYTILRGTLLTVCFFTVTALDTLLRKAFGIVSFPFIKIYRALCKKAADRKRKRIERKEKLRLKNESEHRKEDILSEEKTKRRKKSLKNSQKLKNKAV